MPTTITAYRVFIASPGGLESEREAFRDTLTRYNETDGIQEGVMFLPTGWEHTLGGHGRPQALINRDLRECDYLVLLLANRWGSAPDAEGRYTSGTEEEYNVALECLKDRGSPMTEVVVFFRAPTPEQMSDPGPELQKVIDFRRRIERDRDHLFTVVDSTAHFVDRLRGHLADWRRKSKRLADHPTADAAESDTVRETTVLDGMAGEAAALASRGEKTDAEGMFARAAQSNNNFVALMEYGRFLQADQRFVQALELFERAAAAARVSGRLDQEADAGAALADVLLRLGEHPRALSVLERVLALNERAGRRRDSAATRFRLGGVLRSTGDLGRAEEMHLSAIAILEEIGADRALPQSYAELGAILSTRGDLAGAERRYADALRIATEVGDRNGVATAHGNLASIAEQHGRLEEAEQLYRRAMGEFDEMRNTLGAARMAGNLGMLLLRLNRVQEAGALIEHSLALNQRIGHAEALSWAWHRTGVLRLATGDLDGAEEAYRTALEMDQRMGREAGIARAYRALAGVLAKRGDSKGAEEMLRAAANIASEPLSPREEDGSR